MHKNFTIMTTAVVILILTSFNIAKWMLESMRNMQFWITIEE